MADQFERIIMQYLNNLKNYLRAQPLNLGGVSGTSGGAGGPPGGFIGYIPQTRVAYDTTEAESSGFVDPDTYSLLDNLNHIRYRVKSLESAPGGSLEIQDNDVQVATGVTTLNFEGAMSTLDEGLGKVTITISGGGTGGHTIQEEGSPLTSRTNLNFVGAGVTATDDAGNDATVITIPDYVEGIIVEEDGVQVASDVSTLDFVGAFVTDDGSGHATVTISGNDLLDDIYVRLDTSNADSYDIAIATQEPTGFPNITDTTISWSDSTPDRTFTITGTNFPVYYYGKKVIKNTEDIELPAVSGLYWIFYDTDGSLAYNVVHPGFNYILIATVYWNNTTGKGLLADERHGIQMSAIEHEYLHETVGARYSYGYGGTFNDTTFSIAQGEFYDEDLEYELDDAKTTCLVLYKNGSATYAWDGPQTAYYKMNGANLRYNNGTALANVGANHYVAYWFFIVNDPTNPVHVLMGQRTDVTLANAKTNNTPESLTLGTLPTVESKLLYRVILRNVGATPDFIEATDFRQVSTLPTATYVSTSHSSLTGLQNQDHSASAIYTDTTNFNAILDSADDAVQKALDVLDDHLHDGVYIRADILGNTGDLISVDESLAPRIISTMAANAGDVLTAMPYWAGGLMPSWETPTVFGDVHGPGSSTDHALVRFDGTDGKTIQDSTVVLDDSGNMYIGDMDTYISTPAASLLVQLAGIGRGAFLRTVVAGDGAYDYPINSFFRVRNTFAVPSGIMNGDTLGRITFVGHNGSSYQTGNYIEVKATEDWDGDGEGNAFEFYTSNLGSTESATLALTLGDDATLSKGDFLVPNGNVTISGDFSTTAGNINVKGYIDASSYSNLPVASSIVQGIANFSTDNFSVSAGAVTIKDEGVALAELVHATTTNVILGRSSAGAGDWQEVACTAAGRAILDDATAAAQLTTLGGVPLQPAADVIINDAHGDFNFTFEGDTDPYLLNLDAGADVISIGAAPVAETRQYGKVQITETRDDGTQSYPALTLISNNTGGGLSIINTRAEDTSLSGGIMTLQGDFIPSAAGKRLGNLTVGARYKAGTYQAGLAIRAYSNEQWQEVGGVINAGTYATFNLFQNGGASYVVECARLSPSGGLVVACPPVSANARITHFTSEYGGHISTTAGASASDLYLRPANGITKYLTTGVSSYLELYDGADASPTYNVRINTNGNSYFNGGNVGIGAVPAAISANDGLLQVTGVAGQAYPAISTYNDTAGGGIFASNSSAEGADSGGRLGVAAAFTPSAAGKALGFYVFRGITTGTTYVNTAYISAHSAIAWDSRQAGSYMTFYTTPLLAVTPVEVLRLGDGAKIGFFGVAPVARPTAYTQTYSTASKTVPNNTASAPPAGGVGATAGAYDTAANRNLMITSLTNCITDVTNLKKVVTAIIDDLQALGLLQ